MLWETDQIVPCRRFVTDYAPGQFANEVDMGLWGASKALVYDGQQRMQTLYSVLRNRFNGRTLHYDILFDSELAEADDTGFLFRDANAQQESRHLRMTELSTIRCNPNERVNLEDKLLAAAGTDKQKNKLVRANLSALWEIFVDTNVKSIAFFSVKADTPKEVNEVFRRLNTGGVALTQLELVLSKIKAVQSDYEEKLWALSDKIREESGGIAFSSASILQFFHLLVKDTIRIDEDRLTTVDIAGFQSVLQNDTQPLIEVFSSYLKGILNINNASIVPRWLAVLPIAAYLMELKRNGHKWRIRAKSADSVQRISQYFLLSQFCDWNTQTMINAFSREAILAGRSGNDFPLAVIQTIAIDKRRDTRVDENHLLSQPWFAIKVLIPERAYVFAENKPQVDHIFPLNLLGQDESYRSAVDVLWNFQPIPAEVNNYKRARHPQEFLTSADGAKYAPLYDFIPRLDSPLWGNHIAFIANRKAQMCKSMKLIYGLTLLDNPRQP